MASLATHHTIPGGTIDTDTMCDVKSTPWRSVVKEPFHSLPKAHL